MNLTRYSKLLALLAALSATGLMAGSCEKRGIPGKFVLERMPQEYRACAKEHIPELSGRVTQADLVRYTAKLKQGWGRQNACLVGAIEWADAQWGAFNEFNS